MINTKTYRNNIVNIIGELKKLVDIYKEGEDKKEAIGKLSSAYNPEYIATKTKTETDVIYSKASAHINNINTFMDKLAADLLSSDSDVEFDNTEFTTAMNVFGNSKTIANDLLLNVAENFKGHNNVLKALAGTVENTKQFYFLDRVIDYNAEVEALREEMTDALIDFPSNILLIIGVRDKFVKLADAIGETLTEEEKDMGAGYNDIVNAQMRHAMGLK